MKPIQNAMTIAALVILAGCVAAQDYPEGAATDLDWPQVTYVVATKVEGDAWRFDVTVEHNDEGWDHYADAWQVVVPEGDQVLAERVLLHPHDDEQPFTRSLSRVEIPPEITTVIVRALCTVHGPGPVVVHVDLSVADGEHFTVVVPDTNR